MHKITSSQFRATVELDPAWASKLTEPVEITDFCDMSGASMSGSKISHLSHLLHFTGKDEYGNSASFFGCEFLEIAEGNFEGFVDFSRSKIKRIGELSCGKDKVGDSASFYRSKSLKVAEGNFEGHVSFYGSTIEKIGELSCGENNSGIRLNVEDCPNLAKIPITFDPKEIKANPKLLEKLEVDRFIQKKRAEIVEVEI